MTAELTPRRLGPHPLSLESWAEPKLTGFGLTLRSLLMNVRNWEGGLTFDFLVAVDFQSPLEAPNFQLDGLQIQGQEHASKSPTPPPSLRFQISLTLCACVQL